MYFRYKLEEQEKEIENLEEKLEKIFKLATVSCDSGRTFVVNQRWVGIRRTMNFLSCRGGFPKNVQIVVNRDENIHQRWNNEPWIILCCLIGYILYCFFLFPLCIHFKSLKNDEQTSLINDRAKIVRHEKFILVSFYGVIRSKTK